MGIYDMIEFEVLKGKTLIAVEGDVGDDELLFSCSDGTKYKLYHTQDCCESVYLQDVIGDFSDLIGDPLLLVEVVSHADDPNDAKVDFYDDSHTWTFYKMSTNKGSVTLRWLGESNGYYSEEVDFAKIV